MTTHAKAPGELRIYLGAAPGVGKTYAMLGEAHRRIERGQDIVAAVVETHGREQTAALLAGIELVPPLRIEYRGTVAEEIDVAAVIARDPEAVLVDELAHTNTPGSRNAKRWQDVRELLAAGIDVVSTVNIQHLESLNDVVAQITGVVQRETVPDDVVREAVQIELVDVAPEALQRRISMGHVYAADKIDAALGNYFRRGNLTALRELALLWLADQVDAALAKYRAEKKITATWEARERVVVAVTGGPESETLVRRARRIASKSGAELIVVHVIRGDGLSGVSAPQMGKVRDLAVSLGASLHSVVGDDVPKTLLEFARQVNATQLVLGTSRRSRWARLFDEGIGATTVQQSGPIDVHMVTHEQSHTGGLRRRKLLPRQRRAASWIAALAVPPAVCAVIASFLRTSVDLSGESSLFFLGVLVVALLGGVAPAILSALMSGLLLNYYFMPPLHSFRVNQPGDLLPVVLLLVIAVAVAALVDAAARSTLQARQASREAELLTLFAGSVLRGADLPALLERAREAYAQRGVSLRGQREGVIAAVGEDAPTTPDDADTTVEAGAGEYLLMLAGHKLLARDRQVLNALANQAVGLVRQQQLAEEAGKASALEQADELRRALLSAVSHDLRTPLAAVKAAVSSLRSDDVEFSAADTAELLATVEESTDQLTALVGNLLDSSRLAAGVVRPESRTVYLDEVVHRALVSVGLAPRGFRRRALERVKVDVGTVSVSADPVLLERVVANLVDNALRYGGDGDVRVDAAQVGDRVTLRVIDTGPGLPDGDAQLFDPFQRLGDRDNTSGAGLGLSVVHGFVAAMGGTVEATDTPGGGLTMVVDLAAAHAAAAAGAGSAEDQR